MKRRAERLFLLKLATVAFADGLLDVLVDSRPPDVTAGELLHRCQGDPGAVPGGCELAETAVWRLENPKADNLDALRAGRNGWRRAVGRRSIRRFRSERRCIRMTRSGLVGLQCGSALQ